MNMRRWWYAWRLRRAQKRMIWCRMKSKSGDAFSEARKRWEARADQAAIDTRHWIGELNQLARAVRKSE